MKKYLLAWVVGWLCLVACNQQPTISSEKLEEGFQNPPSSIQTSVYWYWVSGNVSKEGVVQDLESMKAAGINRAFIGNIGLGEHEIKPGPVKLFTDEWWEIIHAALKRASELDIEIGMFNCPGWSQAGGPWIKPEQSMRYLTSTRTDVQGGSLLNVQLPKPDGPFQDVKVLAYPTQEEQTIVLTEENRIQTLPGEPLIYRMDLPADFRLESCLVYTSHTPTRCQVQVKAMQNEQTVLHREFYVNRTNPNPEVGFDPYAPIVKALDGSSAQTLEVQLSALNQGGSIEKIVFSSLPYVEAYPEKKLSKMFQEPLPYWDSYMFHPQPLVNNESLVVSPEQVVDLTALLKGDELTWDAPAGQWTILRMGMLPTQVCNEPAAPEGRGLEVDKLTSEYLQHHFDSFLGEVIRRVPAADRTCLKVVVADSYERGGQNFSDHFIDDFRKRYHYDPIPFFPVYEGVVVGNTDISNRFLWDVRRLVADQLAYKHIGGLREIAHKYGMTLWLENYGHWGFPGEFLQYGGQSDEVSGEFWSEGTLGDIENRAASSCGHIYGKTNISSESFTSGGPAFTRYPALMKQRGDRFFCEGINNTLLHVYVSQYADDVYPGTNPWFGNEFNRKNTWYSQLDVFTDYLKRCNFMLQQGKNVADVAYFIGEDAPKMTGITEPGLPQGYQYDYINAEVILRDMTVENGLFTLPHGTQYKLLVLPPQTTMRPDLLRKIGKLIRQGGAVLGPAPRLSPSNEGYPACDWEVIDLARDLWQDVDGIDKKYHQVVKGMVMSGLSIGEAMALIDCVPDCRISDNKPIHYAHRDLGRMQVYFLSNQSDEMVDFTADFRVTGLAPERWDAISGSRLDLPRYESSDRTTRIPLRLEPYESTFVVFRHASKRNAIGEGANHWVVNDSLVLSAPWTLTFENDAIKRGPSEPIIFDELVDISSHPDERIRYYSGTITYASTFDLTEEQLTSTPFVSFERVGVMAKVYVNDEYAGGLWTAPYRVDISRQVKAGTNQLRVEVVNNWMNRMIGDLRLPVDERRTSATNNPFSADTPLQFSGLIGKAQILFCQ